MTRPIQKEIEKKHLDLFKELYEQSYGKGFPKIIDNDREDPDFLAQGTNGILGVEFTRLYNKGVQTINSHLPATQNGFREGIIKEAERYCKGGKVPPLKVVVFFKSIQLPIGAKNQRKSGMLLGKLVEKLGRRCSSNTIIARKPRSRKLSFIQNVSVKPAPWHRWNQHLITETNPSFIDDLQDIISEKTEKYEEYRNNCQKCWLVIVVDRKNSAQQFKIDSPFDQKTKTHKYMSKFDRVFYLDFVTSRLFELDISH